MVLLESDVVRLSRKVDDLILTARVVGVLVVGHAAMELLLTST